MNRSLLVCPLRKGYQIKNGSFGDLRIFLNQLILKHHPTSKKCKSPPKSTHFMKMALSRVGTLVCCALLLSISHINAQDTALIVIVSDDPGLTPTRYRLTQGIQSEIEALTKYRHEIRLKTVFADYDLDKLRSSFDDAYADEQTSIVIASGALASLVLANRQSYPKPSIATVIIDNELQGIPLTDSATSGENNFTYIQTPFNLARDLSTLYRLTKFKKVGVIGAPGFESYLPFLDRMIDRFAGDLGATSQLVSFDSDIDRLIDSLDDDIDALYVLPLLNETDSIGLVRLFDKINSKRIPSVALLGDEYVGYGALIGYESTSNLSKMPRRVAINTVKILEGESTGTLSVNIPSYSDHIVINMATARSTGFFPDWDLMSEAVLINFNKISSDTVYNLETIIVEVLQHNLGFLAKQKDPRIAQKEIALAKSEFRPQIDASTSLSLIDDTRAVNSFGTQGRTNWFATGSLSQLILAEPAIANIAIQKLLQKASEKELEQAYLDIILEAARSYFNILRAERFLEIALQNETLNRNNYDIASAKEAVGYAGASDLNRWRSELALASIDVNDANAQLEQARLFLNQLLNLPLENRFKLEESTLQDQVVLVTDPRIFSIITNPGDLDLFADFLVEEALLNSPELSQIDFGIAAQERLKLSQQRSFYLPSIAFSGQWDYTLQRWGIQETPGVPVPDLVPAWSIGIGLKYPILQGQRRKITIEQTQLSLLQLKDQQGDLKTKIALNVRSNLQQAGASFSRVNLFEEAAKAAKDNFNIVRDSYTQGAANVTALIDAQNAALQTELSAENATYQFILDFLTLERSIGKIYFLVGEPERSAFFDRLDTYIAQRKIDN